MANNEEVVNPGQENFHEDDKYVDAKNDKNYLTLVISLIAFLMSGYTFIDNNFLHQHSLKTSVISIENTRDSLSGNILFVNTGKSYETIYSGQFIFDDNLNRGGGELSREKIGPFVIPPKQAIIVKIITSMPDINRLKEEGIISADSMKIHLGVYFDIVDQQGNIPENGKIFKITQIQFNSIGEYVGASPMIGDNNGMMELL